MERGVLHKLGGLIPQGPLRAIELFSLQTHVTIESSLIVDFPLPQQIFLRSLLLRPINLFLLCLLLLETLNLFDFSDGIPLEKRFLLLQFLYLLLKHMDLSLNLLAFLGLIVKANLSFRCLKINPKDIHSFAFCPSLAESLRQS